MDEQAVREEAESLVDLTHHIAFQLRAAVKPHADGELSYDAAVLAAATLVAAAHGDERPPAASSGGSE